jgi:hypothetical protein
MESTRFKSAILIDVVRERGSTFCVQFSLRFKQMSHLQRLDECCFDDQIVAVVETLINNGCLPFWTCSPSNLSLKSRADGLRLCPPCGRFVVSALCGAHVC